MTTSNLVGPDSRSSQDTTATPDIESSLLIGSTDRVSAYNRLCAWLRMPESEASAAAFAFKQAVSTLQPEEQEQVAAAEEDALRHGFKFRDFQKLKAFALRALADPFVGTGAGEPEQDRYLMASLLALSN
jgi:hypothetical protein